MKKLVFVIQLIFLYSGLAMADPVISLKTLLHEMTDRSVLARWPENAYTCKQFSSYDRSSHNMTDKRAWFGNFDQGQFIRQEENGGRTEYVMMDAEGPGAIVRFWMTFSGINRGQGTLRIYIDNEEKPVIEGNVRDILSGQVLCGEPLSTSVPDEAPMEERGHNLYLPIPYQQFVAVLQGTAGQQQAALLLVVVDVGFDGDYIESPLRLGDTGQQEEQQCGYP